MYQYPYENISLDDMEGEIWKPLSDYPDYYAISNKGRVKSFARLVVGIARWIQHPHIMRQRVRKTINPYSGRIRYTLNVATCVDNVQKYHTVSRLVYEAFVGPVPKGPTFIIRHKDGDSLNNIPENLYVSNFSKLHKHIIETGDRKRPDGRRYGTAEEIHASYASIRKPVSQFDLKGNFIDTYEAISYAGKKLGIDNGMIVKVATGQMHTAGGFQWRYGNDTANIPAVKSIRSCQRFRRTAKYDLNGQLITVYPSVVDAARENDIDVTRLYGMLKYRNRMPKEGEVCIWRSFWLDEEIPQTIKLRK